MLQVQLSSGSVHVSAGLRLADGFLLFYTSILKPDGDLSLWEVSHGGDPSSFIFGDEFVGRVLLFELF